MVTTHLPLVPALLSTHPAPHDQSSTSVHVVAETRPINGSSRQPRTKSPKLLKQPLDQSSAEGTDQPRIVRIPELSARLGLSVSSVYVLISKSALPKPKTIVPGGRAVGWDSEVVDAWFSARKGSCSEVEQ